MKISLKIQSDNSFPRIIHRKIHFRYIGVNILGSLSPSKNCFLSTWRRDVTASLNFIRYNYIVVVNTLQSNIVKALVTGSTSLSTRGNCNNSIKLSLSVPLSPTNERPKAWLVHVCMDAYCFSVYTLLSLSLSLSASRSWVELFLGNWLFLRRKGENTVLLTAFKLTKLHYYLASTGSASLSFFIYEAWLRLLLGFQSSKSIRHSWYT